MVSGLILFAYIGTHLLNHSLGLISLGAAEAGMGYAVEVWYSLPGTILLYGAFATHFMMALFAVYERRTFRLPPLELLRIVLGFTMPMAHLEKIKTVPGVKDAMPFNWFGGIYKDEKNFFANFATDANQLRQIITEMKMPDSEWNAVRVDS